MSLLNRLSSLSGDRTEQSNREVAALCVDNPALLEEIAAGLVSGDAALAGDCAEVLTMTGERLPEAIVPYADRLATLLGHGTPRVRWEAMHALAWVAPYKSGLIVKLLPELDRILREDRSTIVRDYAIECLGRAVDGNEQTAAAVWPVLRQAIGGWGGKHLARLLTAMTAVAAASPELAVELLPYGHEHADHPRSSVRKEARRLVKTIERR